MSQRGLRADTLMQSVTVAIAVAIVCRFVAFGRGVFLARTLAPEELGTWALIANAIQVLAFACALGVPNGLARYSERFRQAGKLGRFFGTTIFRTLGITSVVCLVGFLFWQPLGELLFSSSATRAIVWVTLGGVAVTVLLSLSQGMLQGLRLFRVNSLFELAQNLGFLALAVVLLSCWRSDAYAAAWANLATTLLAAVVIVWWLRRSTRRESDAGDLENSTDPGTSRSNIVWWPVLAYSLGAWSAGSMQALWRVIDRYMLLHLSSIGTPETLDHLGQYFVASKLGQPVAALAGVLSMALLPHAAKLWENNQRGEVSNMVRTTTKLAAISMAFGGALLVVLKVELVELITGRSAVMACAVFAPVLVTVIAVSLHYILRTYLMCHERAWAIGGVWLVTLLANAALNAVFIPRVGLMGAAWATLISAGIALALTAALSMQSGMKIGPRLLVCLALPAVLLLPAAWMIVALAALAVAVHYTNCIFSAAEKQWINQSAAERFGRYFTGRWGRRLAATVRS